LRKDAFDLPAALVDGWSGLVSCDRASS
jgi:hypothetical protein